jgi:vanillate O-demethylase monooxygenase subunit
MTPNYPRDCWYVAATSDEVGSGLFGRKLLDRPVVLYRLESGQVVALADRCAHRGYPLSKGRLDGDLLVCGYHGLRYDTAGACVGVPSQPNVPYGVGVRAYPVREEPPFVWIWLGHPGSSSLHSPPQLPWLSGDGWSSSGETVCVAANYMLVHEHYLDLTHVPEVHPEETPPGLEQLPPLDHVSVSETSVTYTRTLPPAELADWEAEATGLPRDREYKRRHHGTFISPAILAEGWEIDGGDGQLYEQARIHAVTPESPTRTHLFSRFAHNFALDRALVDQHLHAVMAKVMREDVAVIEAIEAAAGYEGSASGIHLIADAGVLQVRRIVARMLAMETGRTSAELDRAPRSASACKTARPG